MSAFGENLRALRTSRSMSQEDVASALHVSRQSVTKWESGISLPSSSNMVKLSELFEVSLDQLTHQAVEPTPTDIDAEALNKFLKTNEEREQRNRDIYKSVKTTLIDALEIVAGFVFLYFACWFLNKQLGVLIYPWHYMAKYFYFQVTGAISMICVFLKRKNYAILLLGGVLLTVICGQLVGVWSAAKSPLGFNESWIVLLLVCNASFIGIVVAETIKNKKKCCNFLGRRKASITITSVLLVMVLTSVIVSGIFGGKKYLFNQGAEQGYLMGYERGQEDAMDNRPMNSSVEPTEIPSDYQLGTSKFSGFALYWPAGYEDGYNSKEGMPAITER